MSLNIPFLSAYCIKITLLKDNNDEKFHSFTTNMNRINISYNFIVQIQKIHFQETFKNKILTSCLKQNQHSYRLAIGPIVRYDSHQCRRSSTHLPRSGSDGSCRSPGRSLSPSCRAPGSISWCLARNLCVKYKSMFSIK